MGEMRERLARAMAESDGCGRIGMPVGQRFYRLADTALAAIEAAGMVIVPREPSDAMKKAWQGPEPWDQDALEVWQAMIAAA